MKPPVLPVVQHVREREPWWSAALKVALWVAVLAALIPIVAVLLVELDRLHAGGR